MPFKSRAQMRKFKQLEASGELAPGTYDRWLAETPNPKKLPLRVKKPKKRKQSRKFSDGFKKVAFDGDLPGQAMTEASFGNMQNGVPGATLRDGAETGQARGRATRTQGVLNEDKEFGKQYRKKSDVARGGGATKAGRRS